MGPLISCGKCSAWMVRSTTALSSWVPGACSRTSIDRIVSRQSPSACYPVSRLRSSAHQRRNLHDRSWPLADLIRAPGKSLERRLADMPIERVAGELAAFITDRARNSRKVDYRIAAIALLACDARVSIDGVSAQLGSSTRSLRSIAARELRMGAKRFLRIKRVHRAVGLHSRCRADHGRVSRRSARTTIMRISQGTFSNCSARAQPLFSRAGLDERV